MSSKTAFVVLTSVLVIVLQAVVDFAYRVNVSENWDEHRCDPYVVATAGFFKPAEDLRSAVQFARDNWSFCQKQYVESAIRDAAAVPERLASVQSGVVGLASDLVGVLADTFFDVWRMCYGAYSTFQDAMKSVAKLFQNFMLGMSDLIGRMQASALSLVYALISTIVAFLNTTQLIIIVAIVIIGILLILQIVLFFVLLPISGLIITTTAVVSVSVVAFATAYAAAMVGSMGACFGEGTAVYMQDGTTKPIEAVVVGDVLFGGGVVSAKHVFMNKGYGLFDLAGVTVSGDHLVEGADGRLTSVSKHPMATPQPKGIWSWLSNNPFLWCLTTTNRRIPCQGRDGQLMLFADWEEIPDDDVERQAAWQEAVWQTLNGPIAPPVSTIKSFADGGLAPDVMIAYVNWEGRKRWKRVDSVSVGERIYCGLDEITTVVGRVDSMGDMGTDVFELTSPEHSSQLVAAGTWVQQVSGFWEQALQSATPCEKHPARWVHLYTESGTVALSGGWIVRDASDVGLERIGQLVDQVVLTESREAM